MTEQQQSGLTIAHYQPTDEEKCALIELVRFNNVSVVDAGFCNDLLLRVAHAYVTALYDGLPMPQPTDHEQLECDNPLVETFGPNNRHIAMVFVPLTALPDKGEQ